MHRTPYTITIESVDQIPTVEEISKTSRDEKIKLIFGEALVHVREEIGKKLKNDLLGFQVSIHNGQPEINIAKLITDKEIDDNQLFFEQCAKDYRALAEVLISKLAIKLNIEINSAFPMMSFNPFKSNRKQIGTIEGWRYFLHGYHCGFEHKKSGQIVEVPLVFGLEFGDLDPYFFTRFIKSTKAYFPLPVAIYEDYADGRRINERMLAIGKFEHINSNIENHTGIAVKDRKRVPIEIYNPEPVTTQKPKFSLLRFFHLKQQ